MTKAPDNSMLGPEGIDHTALSEAITSLMVRYSDAIEACGSISRLSLLPLPKLYLQMMLWLLALELVILLLPITDDRYSQSLWAIARNRRRAPLCDGRETI